jgi:hypothetical protein
LSITELSSDRGDRDHVIEHADDVRVRDGRVRFDRRWGMGGLAWEMQILGSGLLGQGVVLWGGRVMHVGSILAEAAAPPRDDHRRVLAVVAYLRGGSGHLVGIVQR